MVVGEVAGGLGIFKSIMDLVKTLKDMTDVTSRNGVVIELQEKIFSAQSAQATLLERVSELEKEVTSFERWETERQRYELKDFGRGVLAYSLKPNAQPSEPAHSVCPDCYQNRLIRILQQITRTPGMTKVFLCQHCGWEAYLSGAWYPEHGGNSASRRKG